MKTVLESAAKFQKLVPDAVLVGGSAVSARIGHRLSIDHDHVLIDLENRFDAIFEFLSEQEEWTTAHAKDGKLILGSFDGVEVGLRQLRRARPLETEEFLLENGEILRVPTEEEIVRVKAYLITNRNQVRDYLDVAALADHLGTDFVAKTLLGIDDYYEKELSSSGSVAGELLLLLGAPSPKDRSAIGDMKRYKGIDPKYSDWTVIGNICKNIAAGMIRKGTA